MRPFVSLSRRSLALIALALAAVVLLSVNLAARNGLKFARADLTEHGLYTISDSTRRVLAGLDEPVTVRLYYSKALGERAPAYGQHADRVRSLLSTYADLSQGRLRFEVVEPEPFSDEEDRAVGAGLQGLPLGNGQGNAYFGLVGSNSTDDQEVISFLALERADFLEYDLTKLVHRLADPTPKVVGLLTGLPIAGGMDPQLGPQAPWLVMQQLEEFFTVKAVSADMAAVPADVDVLLIIAPDSMSERASYAVDQFALSGKPVLVFADAHTEVRRFDKTPPADHPLNRLLKAWGAELEPDKVVGDISYARRVQFGSPAQPQVASYVVWMALGRDSFDGADAAFVNVERIVVASPGALKAVPDSPTRFQPLITTSDQAMLIAANELVDPDPVKLLRSYKPGGAPLTLAARLTGEAKTAFPDGRPRPAEKAESSAEAEQSAAIEQPHRPSGPVNVIVVADADLLFDSFWAEARELAGQRFVIPRANNVDLLLNALENLSGGTALMGLRGRGVEERPFTLVENMRLAAEARYREQEAQLSRKLEETQAKIQEIQAKSENGRVILTEEDKQAILGFRQELIAIRRELRSVQRALRQDVERLEFWATFLNTAGVPLAIAIGGLGFVAARRLSRRRAGREGKP